MQSLIAFHIYLYIIETTHAWLGNQELPPMVCEIIGPRADRVRRLSGASKRENEDSAQRAMKKFLELMISRDAAITAKLQNPSHLEDEKAQDLIKKLQGSFVCSDLEGETVEKVKSSAMSKGAVNLKANILDGLTAFGRTCGLVSRQKTNQYRYAPSDQLLETLVLVNVTGKVEEKAFLEHLDTRYRIIIGDKQAKARLDPDEYEKPPFEKNGKRFTERLVALGLAKSLSDACTYINNPYK